VSLKILPRKEVVCYTYSLRSGKDLTLTSTFVRSLPVLMSLRGGMLYLLLKEWEGSVPVLTSSILLPPTPCDLRMFGFMTTFVLYDETSQNVGLNSALFQECLPTLGPLPNTFWPSTQLAQMCCSMYLSLWAIQGVPSHNNTNDIPIIEKSDLT
jgi:hypothetical protein